MVLSTNNLMRFLGQLSRKTHLFTPVYTSFLVLVLLIVGQQGLNLSIELLTQQATDWVTHTLLVELQGEHLLNALINEERASLDAYSKAQIAFQSSLNCLYNLLRHNPTQLNILDQIKYLHDPRQSELAQRAISGVSRYTLAENTLFNSLRTQVLILLEREEILLGERKHWLIKLYHINIAVDILSTVMVLAGVGLSLRLWHRQVQVPLGKLTQVGKVSRAGQMQVRLGYSSPDEIGHLAKVLDAAREVRHRQQRIEVRNQHLEDLICALSHDLRTPLLATRTTLDSMLKGAFGHVSDTWREVFEEYHQANEDLLKLVEALLDVSRYEAGGGPHLSWDTLNWEKIFVKVITQIKATSKREFAITYKISQSLPSVYGDRIEIQRVVQNLLENAIRVSEPNKEIFLEVATLGKAQVQVSVSDQGSGIAIQDKERLFHRFIQGRGQRGRSGLGLYLCRQIVEAHGGTIGVESTLGEGSTFLFTLPVPTDKGGFQYEKEMERSNV